MTPQETEPEPPARVGGLLWRRGLAGPPHRAGVLEGLPFSPGLAGAPHRAEALEGLPWGPGSAGAQHRAGALEGPPWCKVSWRSPLSLHRACRPQGWVTSGQTTTREGVQSHPSVENWIKALLSKALPTRARPSFPITSPSHQEAHTSLSASPIREQTEAAQRSSLTVVKTKTILQKVNHDEKA